MNNVVRKHNKVIATLTYTTAVVLLGFTSLALFTDRIRITPASASAATLETADRYITNTIPSFADVNSDQKTILFFSASWDSHSLLIKDLLLGALAEDTNLAVYQFDVAAFPDVAVDWQVSETPSVIILNSHGEELSRIDGLAAESLERLLNSL